MADTEPPEPPDDISQKIDIPHITSAFDEERKNFSDLQREKLKHRNVGPRDDNKLKLLYFSVTRKLTHRWIKFIIISSALQFAARLFDRGFETAEFVALITTTTVTLVAFWAIVGAYLFPKRRD